MVLKFPRTSVFHPIRLAQAPVSPIQHSGYLSHRDCACAKLAFKRAGNDRTLQPTPLLSGGKDGRHSRDLINHREKTRRSWLGGIGLGLLTGGLGLCNFTADVQAADAPSTRWAYEVAVGPFEIHADFEIRPQSNLLGELDKLSGDVTQLLELPSPDAAIHIVIFSNSEEYRRYMEHYYPALPPRRALFIQQRGTGMLFAHKHSDLATDLRHETTHAILNQGTNPLPLWLDEGLAEYFEVPAAQRWSGQPHLQSIRARACNLDNTLEQLEIVNDVSTMTADHYRDAWAWVHFLLHRRSSTRKLLLDQLRMIRSNRGVLPMSRTVALAVPDWQSEITDHFRRLS